MRDTDDHCIACEQWDLEFERQREMADDHDDRYMDYYDTREGDTADHQADFWEDEPDIYSGTYSEE